MHDIRKLEKCNGPVKALITYCKSEQPWQARSGRVNGKVQSCQPWELLLKRINSLFILRFLSQVGGRLRDVQELAGHTSRTMTQRSSEGDAEAKRTLGAGCADRVIPRDGPLLQRNAAVPTVPRGLGRRPRRAQGRWRRDGQRHADAVASRHPRRPRRPAGRDRDHRARRRLRRRSRGRCVAGYNRAERPLEGRPPVGAAVDGRSPGAGFAGWKKAVERTMGWVDVS